MASAYTGVLCIGDPHLASRVPGHRKDNYPRTILDKLTWSFRYARENRLLPMILGDLFHVPRDNATRMLVEVFELFQGTVLGIAGNHDCKENELGDDDTLSLLHAAGRLRLLERSGPWHGEMGGRAVIIGGSAWGQPLPTSFDPSPFTDASDPLVVWLAHHDIRFPGYEQVGRFEPQEIPGIDIFVNGHIHRPLADHVAGQTTWLNPGNIARVKRSDTDRTRRPSVLRIDIGKDGWRKETVEVPCLPFDEVFHQDIAPVEAPLNESMFIRGLAELQSLKTEGGAGLQAFLEKNLGQFDPRVAAEIRLLAKEVYGDGTWHD